MDEQRFYRATAASDSVAYSTSLWSSDRASTTGHPPARKRGYSATKPRRRRSPNLASQPQYRRARAAGPPTDLTLNDHYWNNFGSPSPSSASPCSVTSQMVLTPTYEDPYHSGLPQRKEEAAGQTLDFDQFPTGTHDYQFLESPSSSHLGLMNPFHMDPYPMRYNAFDDADVDHDMEGFPTSHMDSYHEYSPPPPFLRDSQSYPLEMSIDTPFKHLSSNILFQCALPSSSSSSIDSFSSSCSSTPPDLVVQPRIPLHQPRPTRRIPIISLAALALECDDFVASNNQFPARPAPGTLPLGNRKPDAVERQHAPSPPWNGVSFGSRMSENTVFCSCGCMESYAIP